jgi:hypothetical protein
MSEMAKQARAAMKAKAQRLGADRPTEKVDSSTWSPPELLNADVKTGMRPISRRAYKSGGKVEGSKAVANMGKSVRTGNKPITADSLVNKDMKEANEEREGYKHIGGLKSGGRAKKMVGGPMAGAAKMMQRAQAVGDVPGATMNFSPIKKGALSPLRGMKKGGAASREKYADGGMKAEQGVPLPSIDDASPAKQMFEVYDRHTGDIVGNYGSLKSASRAVDRRDNEYGGYRYGHRPVGRAHGGKTEGHEDIAADKALIKKMVKPSARTGKTIGGAMSMFSPLAMGLNALRGDDDDGKKSGGRAKRATGGGIFSGPGYPGKVPGATGGRTAHARGGKAKGKTNINIIIGAGKPAGMGDMMPNPMGGPTKPPGMDGMPGGMPIAVPPPGGAPGAAPMPMPMPIPMPGPAGPAGPPGMPMPRKSGGRATSYKDMTAGAGSGKGRLEKTEIAERSARKVGGRTYSSYKDMDAGSGGGKGRLEKAEIASKTARIKPGNY